MIAPPSLLLGIGSVRAGKTTLLNNIIFRSREDGFYDAQEYFDQIFMVMVVISIGYDLDVVPWAQTPCAWDQGPGPLGSGPVRSWTLLP